MKTNIGFTFEFSKRRNGWIAKSIQQVTIKHTDGTIVPARIMIDLGGAEKSLEQIEIASESREAISAVVGKGEYSLSAAKRIGGELVNYPVDSAVKEHKAGADDVFFTAWPAQRVTRTVSFDVEIAEAHAVETQATQRQIINLFGAAVDKANARRRAAAKQ